MPGPRMFPFITHTHNLIVAPCPYECLYCWARDFRKRPLKPATLEERWKRRFGKGDFVFLNDLCDAFAPSIPDAQVLALYDFIRASPEARFLLMTKNPDRYVDLCPPRNAVLGCTIECDAHAYSFSKAPPPSHRLGIMNGLSTAGFHDLFISVEPIIDFSSVGFPGDLIKIKPWAVAVGMDNYNWRLLEPSLAKTQRLIEELRRSGITVYEKTLRKAWWEE